MAYFNQKMKKEMEPKIKDILKKYGMKGSLSVRNYSTVTLTLKSGKLDFTKDHEQVNVYYTDRDFTGIKKEFLQECLNVLEHGNHDNSDSQSDYFDVGWYTHINIGKWDKPYILEA